MALASEFDLHPLAVEDAVHGHTRSKLEMFGDDLFMVISTVSYVEHEELTDTSEVVATGQVMVFLGDHFVITVRRGEHAQLSALRRTMEADPARLARGPSEVLYAIADKIIDDYLEVVAEFEKDVDEIESRVFARGGQREVERVYQLKRELIEFKRCVMPLGAPLLRLATASSRSFHPRPRRTFASWLITTPRLGKPWRHSTRCSPRSCRPAWPERRWPTTRTCARSRRGWRSLQCRRWLPASTG